MCEVDKGVSKSFRAVSRTLVDLSNGLDMAVRRSQDKVIIIPRDELQQLADVLADVDRAINAIEDTLEGWIKEMQERDHELNRKEESDIENEFDEDQITSLKGTISCSQSNLSGITALLGG